MFRAWRQRRIEQLEEQAREAQLERAEMLRKLRAFEAACAAIGVGLDSAAPDAVPQVPVALIAATHAPGRGGEPVLLQFDERRVIAVIGPGGEPVTWMRELAADAHEPSPAVLRIDRAALPAGLLAWVAVPEKGSGLTVHVADTLDSGGARAAILTAIRAARRNGAEHDWRSAALWPIAVALPLRFAWAAHPFAWLGGTAAAAVAASVAIAIVPALPTPSPQGGSLPAAPPAQHVSVPSGSVAPSSPVTGAPAVPGPGSGSNSPPNPAQSPNLTTTISGLVQTVSPFPSPSPSPSPKPTHGSGCILWIICL